MPHNVAIFIFDKVEDLDFAGHHVMPVGQLKILQEAITLSIFLPFSILYLKKKLPLDYLWAGLRLPGAVFFLFRSKLMGA